MCSTTISYHKGGASSISQSVSQDDVCRGGEGKVTGLGYGVQEAIIIPTQTNDDAYYRMIASMTFPFPPGLFWFTARIHTSVGCHGSQRGKH